MTTIDEQIAYEMALEEYEEKGRRWKPSLGIPLPEKPRRPVGRPRLPVKPAMFKISIELEPEIITALEEIRGKLDFKDALREALRSALSLPLKFS